MSDAQCRSHFRKHENGKIYNCGEQMFVVPQQVLDIVADWMVSAFAMDKAFAIRKIADHLNGRRKRRQEEMRAYLAKTAMSGKPNAALFRALYLEDVNNILVFDCAAPIWNDEEDFRAAYWEHYRDRFQKAMEGQVRTGTELVINCEL